MKHVITEIKISIIKRMDDGLVGFASFVLDGDFFFGGIGIYARPTGGYRLTYPTRRHINVFRPINKETALFVESSVLKKYEYEKDYVEAESADQ